MKLKKPMSVNNDINQIYLFSVQILDNNNYYYYYNIKETINLIYPIFVYVLLIEFP